MTKPTHTFRILCLGILFCIGLTATAYAQQAEEEDQASIQVISKAWQDSICLRWAPTDPLAWQLASRHGYIITRTTVVKAGQIPATEETITLTPQPIKPLPLPDWEPVVQGNDYAAIAAQALYGERFAVSGGENDIAGIFNESRESELRFSFALFAADMSPAVARSLGLWYTDTQVQQGDRYRYEVTVALPDQQFPIAPGSTYIGLDEAYDLPAPIDVEAEFGDQQVIIRWNKYFFENIYTAWLLERSADGGQTYQLLSEIPMVAGQNENNQEERYLYRSDSLPQNGVEYYYRVRGLTPFGETGPPSEAVSGSGSKPLSALPRITGATIGDRQEKITLDWSFPADAEALEGFHVYLSDKANGTYARLTQKLLKANTRTYTSSRALSSSYFIVEAVAKNGSTGRSYPYFVQLADSIPPAAPTGLQASADTTGLVTLSWEPNTEEDFLAYQVFRTNYESEEMSLVSPEPVYDTEFVDTINLRTLSEEVYYAIVALDIRFNASALSEVFRLERPDILPPLAPAFNNWEVSEAGIRLDWLPSGSTDVAQYLLYRRSKDAPAWTLIHVADREQNLNTYTDSKVQPATAYEYTLLAVDDSGLESLPSSPLRVSSKNAPTQEGPGYLDATADYSDKHVLLRWEYPKHNVLRYHIYKQIDGTFRMYGNQEPGTTYFTDKQVKEGQQYRYRVQVLFTDGTLSTFSPIGKVKY